MSVSSGFLPVDGALLYYELRGADGPPLLLVSAGMGTAQAHELTSARFARRFRVLTYDRRGFARSRGRMPLDDDFHPSEIILRNARDAASLLQCFSPDGEPAFVFGSCFGGAIVLQLLQSNPELVKLAVVHEPAVPLLVAENERQSILSIFDALPGLKVDMAAEVITRLIMDDTEKKTLEQSSAYDRLVARSARNMSHFFSHEARYARTHTVDWDLLQAEKDKLILAVGIESRLPLQRDPARCIAARTGSRFVVMPGAHFPFSADRVATVEQIVSLFGLPPLGRAGKSSL